MALAIAIWGHWMKGLVAKPIMYTGWLDDEDAMFRDGITVTVRR